MNGLIHNCLCRMVMSECVLTIFLQFNVAGELLAGERNLNCPDPENSRRNPWPFCQNSKGEFKLLNKCLT